MLMREWMELEGVEQDKIMVRAPKTKDELGAESKLVLINADDPDGAVIDSPDDDHNAYIRIFQTADSNATKTEAIRRRYEAIEAFGRIDESQQATAESGLNASTAQMASKMMQETSTQPSLADVTA